MPLVGVLLHVPLVGRTASLLFLIEHSLSNSVFFFLSVQYDEYSATRRHQANLWLQEMVGDLGLSYDSTEEDLRLCLRNGLILCKLINKVQPGAVPKVRTPTYMCMRLRVLSLWLCSSLLNWSRCEPFAPSNEVVKLRMYSYNDSV